MNDMIKEIELIVTSYCNFLGVDKSSLFKNTRRGKVKKYNGVSLSTMRMALGYYLCNNYPLTLSDIAKLIGYADHSAMSFQKKVIQNYLECNDRIFGYYYETLLDIARPINTQKQIFRLKKNSYFIEN